MMFRHIFWSTVCRFAAEADADWWRRAQRGEKFGNSFPKQNHSEAKGLAVLLSCCWIEVTGAAERDDGASD